MGTGLQILLVDDHPLVAAGIAAALAANGHQMVVAQTMAEARRWLGERSFDMGLIDINLADGKGVDLIDDPALADRMPGKLLIISGVHDPDEILMALDDRGIAFISKGVPFEDVLAAIARLGEMPAMPPTPMIWEQTRKSFVPVGEVFRRGSFLSPKEREVFQLMRQGLSDKEIAFRLSRSIHTVRVQIRSIRRKRGSTRRGETM
ncbi:MAG: response regulator transcription factor [Proteobacteria bacterium]|nr:response regulator transcription factor [Pseudomonadota bacterium]